MMDEKQGHASRKTRTGIAFRSVNNYKHCVGSLSGDESAVDGYLPGLVPLSEVSLAESLGRTVGAKPKRMATRDRASCFLRVFDSPRELWLRRLMPGG